jgi:hypothetical protein
MLPVVSEPRKRPLRYRRINLRPDRRRRRGRIVGAVLLGILALWTIAAVVRGLILSAEASRLDHVSWGAVGVSCVFALVAACAAWRLWRKARDRS